MDHHSNLISTWPLSIHAIELNFQYQRVVVVSAVPHDDVPRRFELPAWVCDVIFWVDEVVVAVCGIIAVWKKRRMWWWIFWKRRIVRTRWSGIVYWGSVVFDGVVVVC